MVTTLSAADVAREIDIQGLARELAARLDPLALLDAEDVVLSATVGQLITALSTRTALN
jgi:hypothetical protein